MEVRELSETELIAHFAPLLPRGAQTLRGPGDDAAVLALRGDLVVTTDVLVEGHHFRADWSSGPDVGWRAAMQNLADVAAMGATPIALVVALTLPGATKVAWVADFARGLAQACAAAAAQTGIAVGVEGGDLSGGPVLSAAVTALGDLAGRPGVLRSGARPGDVVAHAGVLGHSAAGLALLDYDDDAAARLPAHAHLVVAFRRPSPPLAAGLAAAAAGATAMLDVSDGLLRDAARIGAASGVRLDLTQALLEPDAAALEGAAAALGVDPWEWILTGGEDHGMLATFGPGTPLPEGFRAVGVVVESNDAEGTDAEGTGAKNAEAPRVTLDGATWRGATGWDHFSRA